jgi:SAM-dependent methyltransferase
LVHFVAQLKAPNQINREAWDERARRRLALTESAGDAEFANPWRYLDDCGWLGRNVTGKRVLCLAAGGGWHAPLFASVGANVTVVDISPEMLAQDRKIARERALSIHIVEGTMEDLSMFGDGQFEIVIQPVSTCYVRDISKVYREIARILASIGLYISQHKQPVSLQAEVKFRQGYRIAESYYHMGPLPAAPEDTMHREPGTLEYLHRWDDLLGGLCRAGFVIEDVAEPRHGDPHARPETFRHRSWFIPPYITVKARRTSASAHTQPQLWIP